MVNLAMVMFVSKAMVIPMCIDGCVDVRVAVDVDGVGGADGVVPVIGVVADDANDYMDPDVEVDVKFGVAGDIGVDAGYYGAIDVDIDGIVMCIVVVVSRRWLMWMSLVLLMAIMVVIVVLVLLLRMVMWLLVVVRVRLLMLIPMIMRMSIRPLMRMLMLM